MARRATPIAEVVVVVAGVLSVAVAAVPAIASEPAPVCATVHATSAQPTSVVFVDGFESGDTVAWNDTPTFSATEIIDVGFVVSFAGPLSGDHLLELRIRTPNRHPYQTLTTPITTNPERAHTAAAVVGFPRPLRVRLLEPAKVDGRSLPSVVVAFPVGGTNIATGSLYGLWSVEPFLDGESVACGEMGSFVLVE